MLSLPNEKKWQIYCSQRLLQEANGGGGGGGGLDGRGGGGRGGGAGGRASAANGMGRGLKRDISDPEFYIEKIKALAMVSVTRRNNKIFLFCVKSAAA